MRCQSRLAGPPPRNLEFVGRFDGQLGVGLPGLSSIANIVKGATTMFNFDLILRDLKMALRSLGRTKGVAITVVLTPAVGMGANGPIFSVVRGVLLRPLVNRDEDRLIYIRQSSHGIGVENTTFSVPEIQDLQSRVKTVGEFGDFSTIHVSMVGFGEPREVRGGVGDGSCFEVMGLRPVPGRVLDAHDDGPNAARAVALTFLFWPSALHSDRTVLGKT